MKLFIFLFISSIFTFTNSFAQVAVIANKSIKTDKVTISILNNLYQLDQTDLGSVKVQLFDISEETPVKNAFYTALGKSVSEFKKLWLKKKLTGNGNPPKALGSEEEVLSKVASTPGAVGYISASKVNSSVIVLLTIK